MINVMFNLRSATRRRHQPKPVAAMIGAFMISPVVTGAVTTLTSDVNIGYAGSLYWNNQNNYVDFDASITSAWNGLSAFDQTVTDQVSGGGESLTASSRLQLNESTTAGVTTFEYRETHSTSISEGVDFNSIGFSYSNEVDINFVTTGWTQLDFTNVSGGLASSLFYNLELTINSGAASEGVWDPDLAWNVGSVTGISHDTVLLFAAGSYTISLSDYFMHDGGFDDTANFDMQFSNFAVPGPGAIASLLGVATMRRRRRR